MTDKIPESIITISLNEKANIEKCLKSLESFDEVWLMNSNSTDRTCEIAESMGAKVVYFDWNRKYLEKSSGYSRTCPSRRCCSSRLLRSSFDISGRRGSWMTAQDSILESHALCISGRYR